MNTAGLRVRLTAALRSNLPGFVYSLRTSENSHRAGTSASLDTPVHGHSTLSGRRPLSSTCGWRRSTSRQSCLIGSRSPVLLRISTPLAGERALCEVAKTATLAAHHSHSVDCKAERVRPGKCGNDTPIVSSASWCRLKTVTRYGRRTSPRRRGTSRLTAQTSGVRCCALKTNPACPVFVATLRGYAQASVQHLLLHR